MAKVAKLNAPATAPARRRGMMWGLSALLAAGPALAQQPAPASAEASGPPSMVESCATAYEAAQEQRLEGRLAAALSHLDVCAQAACPSFIGRDCTRWRQEVEAALPTVVFSARREGWDMTDVTVHVDGKLLTRTLDGRSVPLDPGRHTVRFQMAGVPAVDREVVVLEGQKNRLVQVVFPPPAPKPLPPAPPAEPDAETTMDLEPTAANGKPVLPWVLGGVGVLGVSTFAILGLSGLAAEEDLEQSCAPTCGEDRVRSIRTKYVVGDLGLAVGLASLGAAAYLWFRGAGDAEPGTDTASVGVGLGDGGGRLMVRGRF